MPDLECSNFYTLVRLFHKNNLIDKKRILFQPTWPHFCLEMVPVSIKRKGLPNPIPSQPRPHRIPGWARGPEAREPSSKNTKPELEPGARSGSGKGWLGAQLTEPFPPRLGQVSCPEGTEHTPRQRGAGSWIGGGGNHWHFPHLGYFGAERPSWGSGAESKGSGIGLELSAGWPFLEE